MTVLPSPFFSDLLSFKKLIFVKFELSKRFLEISLQAKN